MMRNKIQDIAPLIASDFVDFDADAEFHNNYFKLLTDNFLRIGVYVDYLCSLHDSCFIKTALAPGQFSLVINDISTLLFAEALILKKGLNSDHQKLIFPLQLDFELSDLSFNSVDDDGFICKIEPTEINEYLGEQILSVDSELVSIGLVVWKNHIGKKPGTKILILIHAKSIKVTELQHKAWLDIFGDKYNGYFEYYKLQLLSGRYLSVQTRCLELIDEFDILLTDIE